MICIRCKKIVHKKNAIPHPQGHNKYYCPTCKRIIFDFGHEPASISSLDKIDAYDKKPDKPRSLDNTAPYYTNVHIDTHILECKDALIYRPHDIEARITLAKLYLINKNINDALDEATKLLRQIKYNRDIFILIADIYAANRDYENAATYCRKVMARNPQDIDARFKYGIAMIFMGNYSLAASHINKVLKLDPDNKEARLIFGELIDFYVGT